MSGFEEPLSPEQQQAMAQAMGNVPLPQVFFNGFGLNHSATEITSVLTFGARPLVMLVMAPVVAKSLALTLLETVNRYEAATGTEVRTIADLNERIAAHSARKEP